MKYFMIALLVAVILCAAGIWVGIESGYRSAMEKACAYQHATMVLSIKALNELKSGDTNAIGTMQSLGFGAALFVLESCSDSIDTNLPSFTALINYRLAYRTNRSEWTPAEHELDRVLSKKFGGIPMK